MIGSRRLPWVSTLVASLILEIAGQAAAQEAEAPEPEPELVPPKLEALVEPVYPPAAVEAGVEGDVVLSVEIGADGTITGVEVLEEAGHGLDEAAVEAAKRLRFTPATFGGEPVGVQIRYRFRFRMPEVAPEPRAASEEPPPEPKPPADLGSPVTYGSVVRARRAPRSVARKTVEQEEIRRMPGATGDMLKVVQNLPGVARGPFTSGVLLVRGAGPEDSRAYVDGVWTFFIYHFGGFSSAVSSAALSRFDFHPGDPPVRYGRSLGGVIEIETRTPRSDGYHGFVDLQGIEAQVLAEGPVPGGSLLIAARRSLIDIILPAATPDGALEFVAAPTYHDYQLIYATDPKKRDRFQVMLFGSDDSLDLVLAVPPESDPGVRGGVGSRSSFHRLKARWQRDSGDWTYEVTAAGGFDHADFKAGPNLDIDFDGKPVFLRADAGWKASEKVRWAGGLDVVASRYDWSVLAPLPPKEGQVPKPLATAQVRFTDESSFWFQPGLWLDATLGPYADLTAVPGIRMDYTRLNDQLTFDPRLSLTYLVTEGTSLKGAAGVHHQPPNPDELDPIFGNPDLENEQALSFSLGIEQALPWGIQVDVTAFHKRLTNVIAISDEPGENYHNEGIGRVSGLEVFGRRALSNGLFAWLSYTLMKAERKDGPDKPWRHFDFDQTHILTAAVSAEVGAGWIAGFRLRWVTGNPWTPQMPGVFDSDGDVNVPALGDHGAIRLPDYFSLDVRVDKKWEFTSWELSVYVDVWNATNRANAEGLIYNHDHTESTPLQSLPIFPSLGMRAEL